MIKNIMDESRNLENPITNVEEMDDIEVLSNKMDHEMSMILDTLNRNPPSKEDLPVHC